MWRWQKTHAITWSLGAQYHGSEPRVACFREAVQSSRLLHISPSSSMGSSRFHDYWDQFIWDHSFQIIHLRPHSFETCSFETTFIWDLFIWDRIHLRPHSFETTFIWDHSHLRSHSFETMAQNECDTTSFETTIIWDHSHLRPHSFETTLIWYHIHFVPC